MAAEILMPKLSDSMEEGSILTWLKRVGDEVAVGDELVEIEADKANVVYAAEQAGTLIQLLAEEGDAVAVGDPIALIGERAELDGEAGPSRSGADAGEPGGEPDAQEPAAPGPGPSVSEPIPAPPAAPVGVAEGSEDPAPRGVGARRASPLARRLAREAGIDLATVQGTGPHGRIQKRDVEALLGIAPDAGTEGPPAGPPAAANGAPDQTSDAVELVELTKLEQRIARRMAESKATIPHFYLNCEVDATQLLEARARLKSKLGEGVPVPSVNDLVVKAAALALREFPRANSRYRDGALEVHSRINIGIAVAAPNALLVPTIFDADRKGLTEIAAEARTLAARVREGAITPPELAGGTFTVSNLGMYGMSSIGPVINPPQAAILGVGQVAQRPVLDDGELRNMSVMTLTLACDHRVLYGAEAAEFLGRIRGLLEEPFGLAL